MQFKRLALIAAAVILPNAPSAAQTTLDPEFVLYCELNEDGSTVSHRLDIAYQVHPHVAVARKDPDNILPTVAPQNAWPIDMRPGGFTLLLLEDNEQTRKVLASFTAIPVSGERGQYHAVVAAPDKTTPGQKVVFDGSCRSSESNQAMAPENVQK